MSNVMVDTAADEYKIDINNKKDFTVEKTNVGLLAIFMGEYRFFTAPAVL